MLQHKSHLLVRFFDSYYFSKASFRSLLDTHKPGDEPIPSEFTTDITLFDTVYSPYAHSYLCWGKNEALRRYRARLLNSATNGGYRLNGSTSRFLIRDPCLARGANDTVTTSNIFGSSCTANEKEKFNPNITASTFIFIGSGNASLCRERLVGLFDAKRSDQTVNCSFKQEYCTFDHTFQPALPSNLRFIGLSGYYYVFNNLAYGKFEIDFSQKQENSIIFFLCLS